MGLKSGSMAKLSAHSRQALTLSPTVRVDHTRSPSLLCSNRWGTQAEINVQPGISYYFELGPVVRTNLDAFQYESMGVTGQLVPSRPGPNSPFTFFSLDATAGAASVARIRIRNS